jgi:hypothetical protein
MRGLTRSHFATFLCVCEAFLLCCVEISWDLNAALVGTFQLLRLEAVRAFCDRACDSGASVWTFATPITTYTESNII